MTDRPINLADWQVRAALDGRLSLVVEPVTISSHRTFSEFGHSETKGYDWCFRDNEMRWHEVTQAALEARLPRQTGDRLWVRETWRPSISAADPWHVAVLYPNDGKVCHWGWSSDDDFGDWIIPKAAAKGNVSSQIMPRWASRLTMIVTDVRVMRVQDIREEQSVAAGCAKHHFQDFWNARHAKRGLGWAENPWVTASIVTVHRCNIDQMESQNG